MTLTQVTTEGIKAGTITGSDLATNIDLVDNQKLRFGNSQDLKIYHDGSESWIKDTGTGDLNILATDLQIKTADDTEFFLTAVANGAVSLYHNGSKKFETTASGVKVTQLFLEDSTNSNDNAVIFGTGSDMRIYHDGNNGVLQNDTGSIILQNGANNAASVFIKAKAGEHGIIVNHNGGVELYHDNNNKKFETTSAGINVTGSQIITDGNLTVNNGTNSQVFLQASDGSIELTRSGGSAYIDFKNDATEDNDARIQENNGGFHFSGSSQIGTNLTVLNDLTMGGEFNMTSGGNKNRFFDSSLADGEALHVRSTQGGDANHENMAQFHRNAGVNLFYDNFLKFSTIATGARIENVGTGNFLGTNAGDAADLLQLHQQDVSNTTTYDFMNFRFANGSTHATSEMRFRRHVDVTDQGYFGLRDQALTFGYGNSEKMRMNSNGDFLVGNNSPNVTARLSSSSPQFGGFFETTGNTAANGIPLIINRQVDDGVMIEFKTINNVRFTINWNGSNAVYGGTSDYRVKQNIKEISNPLTKLKELKPKRFNFKWSPDRESIGFIAHELQEVVPQAVTGTKDEMYEDDETKPKYQNVDNAHIVPLLVAALQEAIDKIEALETEVAALKAS